MSSDRPRLLARASERGYVETQSLALPGEPEAVPADYEEKLSLQARRREADRQRAAWADARIRIIDGVSIARASRP